MSVRGAEWIDDVSREESPDGHDGHDGSPEKRASKKRKVLSCYACRNRKMRCDRVYPVCGRCQKTGRADQCAYDPRLLDEPPTNGDAQADGNHASFAAVEGSRDDAVIVSASSDALRWKIRAQERRIEVLERQLVDRSKNRNPSEYVDHPVEDVEIKEEMMYRGKGFKTSFHGVTSVMSIIARYRELQVFTRQALTVDHSILRVRTDFKTFRDRRKVAMKDQSAHTFGTVDEIYAALPDKDVVDVDVARYFKSVETTFRILHEPTFWAEYNTFWQNSSDRNGQVTFAVMLVLIMATAKCLSLKDDTFIGDTTADRQAASDLISTCDAWITRQSRKRLTLAFFQIQCLSLIAKRVNCVSLKQDWVASGDLVRLALASGMHRNPALLATGKISEYEKEMKKRLWVTIMELELQSSIESGLQSSLAGLYFDTPGPTNIPDDAFNVESQQMPADRPLEHFTSTSYLCASLKSLPLRIHLAQLLNKPTSDLQYSDILHYDAQIQAAISSLPQWDEDCTEIPNALLQLQLRQYLLILHRPYANLASHNKRYTYSLTSIVDTSSAIIAAYDALVSRGIVVLNNSRNDAIRVGLSLSQVVYNNCTRQPVELRDLVPGNPESPRADRQSHFADIAISKSAGLHDLKLYFATLPTTPFLAKTLCTSSLEVLERSRLVYEQKVMRLGTGYMEYWLMSAAVGMLPPIPSSALSIAYVTCADDDILSRCRKTLDFFTTLAFRVLALQRDPENSFASSLRNTMASVSPSDGRTPSLGANAVAGSGPTAAISGQSGYAPMPGMDYVGVVERPKELGDPFDALHDMQVDMGGWSFPDYWAFDLGGDF